MNLEAFSHPVLSILCIFFHCFRPGNQVGATSSCFPLQPYSFSTYSRPEVLKFRHVSQSPGRLVKHGLLGHLQSFPFSRSWVGSLRLAFLTDSQVIEMSLVKDHTLKTTALGSKHTCSSPSFPRMSCSPLSLLFAWNIICSPVCFAPQVVLPIQLLQHLLWEAFLYALFQPQDRIRCCLSLFLPLLPAYMSVSHVQPLAFREEGLHFSLTSFTNVH